MTLATLISYSTDKRKALHADNSQINDSDTILFFTFTKQRERMSPGVRKACFSFFVCIQDLCSSKHNFFNAVRIEDGIQQHSDSVLVGA